MKNSNLYSLKNLTEVFLFVGIILYIITLVAPYLFTAKPNETYKLWLDISPNTIFINSIWDKILLFFSILNYSILLYALYEFRTLLILFQNDFIFKKETHKQLKLIGKLVKWSALIFFIIEIILMVIHWKRHTAMCNLYAAIFCIGYFFDVLAEVFKRGRKLQEENELTI